MKTYQRHERGGRGGTTFARGPRQGGYGDRAGARPDLHDATCSSCGNSCQVPFRPNGSKPIFCRDCFKRDDAGPKRFERPSYGEKRPFKKFGDKPQGDLSAIERRLSAIETKIDALIDALTADDEDEKEEDEG
jgi:CxxC-x17-CxxC domain-containing protein